MLSRFVQKIEGKNSWEELAKDGTLKYFCLCVCDILFYAYSGFKIHCYVIY